MLISTFYLVVFFIEIAMSKAPNKHEGDEMSNTKSSKKSKLNGSADLFADALRSVIAEAVEKDRDDTINPIMELINETRTELKRDNQTLTENMNEQFRAQDKAFKQLSKEVRQQR